MIWSLLALQVLRPGAPILDSAIVRIDVSSGAAMVSSRYVIEGGADPVVFEIIRLEGQSVVLVSLSPRAEPEELDGLYRLRFIPGDIAERGVELVYRVEGDLVRIPVYVPQAPTDPSQSDVRIELSGMGSTRITDTFPRFVTLEDGTHAASLANLPSLVHLPSASGISVNRVADALVVVLLVLSSGYWLVRSRRALGAGRPGRPKPASS